MSRRHTPSLFRHGAARTLAAALAVALLIAAIVPATAMAQFGNALERQWELLTYRNQNGQAEPVPPGVTAQVLIFSGNVSGEAACSTFEANYVYPGGTSITFRDISPQSVDCDLEAQAFDELFYRHLAQAASFELDGSILRLYDSADLRNPLMVLTSAKIDNDPTVARWSLERIGSADGSVEDVIAGSDPWIEFLPGGSVVGGSEACGSFLGSYSTVSQSMDISDVRFRLRDCPEPILDQLERAITSLAEITSFEVRPAGLVLQDTNRTTRLALEPKIDVKGRTWTPTEILDGSGQPRVQSNVLATSAIRFDGPRADGATICRPFRTESLRSGLALNVVVPPSETFVWDGDSCKNAKATKYNETRIENVYIESLGAAASYALRGSQLELKDVDGRTIMRLEPQAELFGVTWVVQRLGEKRLRNAVGDPITLTFEEQEPDSGLVLGYTGACPPSGACNDYLGFYTLPAATRISIEDVTPAGDACKGDKRKKQPQCKQEQEFLGLLSKVDTYVVKEDVLRLNIGPRPVIVLEPQQLVNAGNAGDIQ